MNRRTPGLFVSQAIDGFLKNKLIEGLSERTLDSYRDHLSPFQGHIGDVPITEITTSVVEDFFFWLRTDYSPKRLSGKQKPLSNKTVYNYWVTLKSFFSWCEGTDLAEGSPMTTIPRPKFQENPVEPFTRDEIEAVLKACKFARAAETNGRQGFKMMRPTFRRDSALVYLLLDTGVRASEACSLRIRDVDLNTGEVTIRHGADGGAKGKKGRTVIIGKRTRHTLWRYLVEREDKDEEQAPLFVTLKGNRLNRDSLRLLIRRLGERVNVKNCHPHRFRHTFAIRYLRSQGDVFTLQVLLGHKSLEMVRRYARIARIDLERNHALASPVDRWNL
jgi:integrase/recombinase XerD